jgi:spermidine synthase
VARGRGAAAEPTAQRDSTTRRARLGDRLAWVLLAFVPSSLMLGVTTHLSIDVAAVPLLWVLPLALYLLSFILAFTPSVRLPWVGLTRLLGVLAVANVGAAVLGIGGWGLVPVHLLGFFVAAVVLHRALALRRPPARDLTAFYLLMSLGGALGGAFNSLVAPGVFVTVAEYPMALVAAAWLRPSPAWRGGRGDDAGLSVGLPIAVAAVLLAAWGAGAVGVVPFPPFVSGLGLAFALALTFANSTRPAAVALLVVVLVWSTAPRTGSGGVLFSGRSFFGVHQVVASEGGGAHLLRHGSTLHGWQAIARMDRCEPATYFHRSGPIGQLFATLGDQPQRVAVIGLGSGALACYAQPGSRWTFYEIDPMVRRIADDPRLFTFLANAASTPEIVLGDGRITLAAARPAEYDVIVMDAFSSDAVPMHLLTEEFIRTAEQRLRPGGLLAFNISNRYLDLEPTLTATGHRLGLRSWTWFDGVIDEAQRSEGKTASRWLLMARQAQPLPAAALARWVPGRMGARAWSDDFSNLLDAVAWTAARAAGQR